VNAKCNTILAAEGKNLQNGDGPFLGIVETRKSLQRLIWTAPATLANRMATDCLDSRAKSLTSGSKAYHWAGQVQQEAEQQQATIHMTLLATAQSTSGRLSVRRCRCCEFEACCWACARLTKCAVHSWQTRPSEGRSPICSARKGIPPHSTCKAVGSYI